MGGRSQGASGEGVRAAFRVVDENCLALRLNWAEVIRKERVKKEMRGNAKEAKIDQNQVNE